MFKVAKMETAKNLMLKHIEACFQSEMSITDEKKINNQCMFKKIKESSYSEEDLDTFRYIL